MRRPRPISPFNLNTALVIPIVAIYGAVVSTLSFFLALKVFRAGRPDVELDYEVGELHRSFSLDVRNTGRADVTISSIELYIERHVITHRSPISSSFAMRIDPIERIPTKIWRDSDDADTSFRLASHSEVIIPVKCVAIKLPSEFPITELLLKFVASHPGGTKIVYMRAEYFLDTVPIETQD